jgi:hypothetical protein
VALVGSVVVEGVVVVVVDGGEPVLR